MSCCGQRRALSMSGGVAPTSKVVAQQSPMLIFQYTGKTGMTVVGSSTGRIYRFSEPGSRVQVDPRDQRSLAGVPNLRPQKT
jgi:hypothetical protein